MERFRVNIPFRGDEQEVVRRMKGLLPQAEDLWSQGFLKFKLKV